MKSYTVFCKECGERHETEDVKFLDVSEDIQGRDIFKFVCPVTGVITEGLVYANR